MNDERWLSIAEMADHVGLSTDTLRWYEKDGILPSVSRNASGYRRYGPRERDIVILLSTLRGSGMSTRMMKAFVGLLAEGAASHGRRIELLEQTREQLQRQRRKIDEASAALDNKIRHYEELIAAGLDCDGAPVADGERARQASRI